MKQSLIVPMPDVRNARPYLDRTTLVVELDIDRAIAGEAFSEQVMIHGGMEQSRPLPTMPIPLSWMSIN